MLQSITQTVFSSPLFNFRVEMQIYSLPVTRAQSLALEL